jgi:hypothetical protein
MRNTSRFLSSSTEDDYPRVCITSEDLVFVLLQKVLVMLRSMKSLVKSGQCGY